MCIFLFSCFSCDLNNLKITTGFLLCFDWLNFYEFFITENYISTENSVVDGYAAIT